MSMSQTFQKSLVSYTGIFFFDIIDKHKREKNFNLHLLNGMNKDFDISLECFLWQDLSIGSNRFDLDVRPSHWKF
jgi:hypothetical protein